DRRGLARGGRDADRAGGGLRALARLAHARQRRAGHRVPARRQRLRGAARRECMPLPPGRQALDGRGPAAARLRQHAGGRGRAHRERGDPGRGDDRVAAGRDQRRGDRGGAGRRRGPHRDQRSVLRARHPRPVQRPARRRGLQESHRGMPSPRQVPRHGRDVHARAPRAPHRHGRSAHSRRIRFFASHAGRCRARLASAEIRSPGIIELMNYNPEAKFEIEVHELPFRRTERGRQLMARVYQPLGAGPFPALLDLHGGAWNDKDRFANEPMARAIAASGVLVASIDPTLGVLGSSTGGHLAQLVGMRPRDARYGALALPEARGVDATVRYIVTRSPISDPFARYQQAEKRKRADMMQKTKNWFVPWDAIYEANPQQILERREPATLPPILIMQGSLDDNVLPALQEKFAATYRAAGGECKLEIFENCDHMWVAEPGSQTDRAHEMVKDWIQKYCG